MHASRRWQLPYVGHLVLVRGQKPADGICILFVLLSLRRSDDGGGGKDEALGQNPEMH